MIREIIGRRNNSEPGAVTEFKLHFLPLKVLGLKLKTNLLDRGQISK